MVSMDAHNTCGQYCASVSSLCTAVSTILYPDAGLVPVGTSEVAQDMQSDEHEKTDVVQDGLSRAGSVVLGCNGYR